MMLKGKTALVTGSTSGIGLAIARSLAAEGCDLILNGFGDAAEIEALVAEIARTCGVAVVYDGADMSKPDQIEALFANAAPKGVDILVNNAGIQHVDKIEDFPVAQWDRIIAINLSSAFHTSRLALPGMKARGWGRILNIASAHGLVASAEKSAYVAAKHGIVGLTKVAALETAESGVTCNAICPGWVRTPLVERQIEAKAKEGGIDIEEASRDLLAEKQPTLRFTTPEQLGGVAVFLCSPAADNITGISLPVDGAWTAR
ncbi:3-hydroxybutyrate dehydrogenase [Tistrella sp. BH-R2-4]|uniref:3-hydroxybutyrate dehydrogenase n=2 Tax=Geminicoccaceae TaxID=2066434 RepID=A0ABU9YJE5_9PROT